VKERRYIIPIFIPHLACPHRCVFCDQNTIAGVEECPGPAYVEKIINNYLATMRKNQPKEIAFFGGSFSGLPLTQQQRLLSVARKFARQHLVDNIRISTRPDYIDKNRLSLLKEFGVGTVELGIQSFDDRVLACSGRGHTVRQSVKAYQLLRESGFWVGIQLMPGLPKSSEGSDFKTVRKTIELKPDFCRLYPTVVLKGTGLEKMYQQGIYRPLTLETTINFTKRAAVLLQAHDISVIRIGLHPSRQLEQAVVAGPYHQALGHLVYSRIFYDLARLLLLKNFCPTGCTVALKAHPSQISSLVGFRRLNLIRLRCEFPKITVNLGPDRDLAGDKVAIHVDGRKVDEASFSLLAQQTYI